MTAKTKKKKELRERVSFRALGADKKEIARLAKKMNSTKTNAILYAVRLALATFPEPVAPWK